MSETVIPPLLPRELEELKDRQRRREHFEKAIGNAESRLFGVFTFNYPGTTYLTPANWNVDEQMATKAFTSFIRNLSSRWRYNENIAYIYGLETKRSALSAGSVRPHIYAVLLSNANLDHKHLQSLWGYSTKHIKPYRRYPQEVVLHADQLKRTFGDGEMNDYLEKERTLHKMKLKVPPRRVREDWEEENYRPSFQVGNCWVTPYDFTRSGIDLILRYRRRPDCHWDVSSNFYCFDPTFQPATKHQRRVLRIHQEKLERRRATSRDAVIG
jgi:hypothetical protein